MMNPLTALAVCVIQILLASYVIECTSGNLTVAIVNNDAKQTGRSCEYREGCFFKHVSCKILAQLHKRPLSQVYFSDLDSTVKALGESTLDAAAVIYFNENYTDSFVARAALGEYADAETIESGQIHVWLPRAPASPDGQLRQYIQSAFDDYLTEMKSECSFPSDHDYFSFKDYIGYSII